MQRPWGIFKEWSEPEKEEGGKVREGAEGGITGASWATLRPWGFRDKVIGRFRRKEGQGGESSEEAGSK